MRALGKKVRERSSQNVAEEMEWLVDTFHPRRIIFIDETYTLRKHRILELTDLIIAKGLHKKVRWVAQTRADRCDSEVFSRMKQAGCEKVEFGVESGNQEILNHVEKNLRLSQVVEGIRTAKKAGLETACSFILGHPYETEETIQDTINFAVKLKPDFVSFGIMAPYPGTKIWEMVQSGEGNYHLLSDNWNKFLRFGGGCLELTNLSFAKLERLQAKAYIHFYLRTFKLIRLLQQVGPRLGQIHTQIRKLIVSR